MSPEIEDRLKLMASIKIRIYPEMIAAAESARVLDLYIVWHVLKEIDSHYNNGRGLMRMAELQDMMSRLFGVGTKYTYERIAKGALQSFWHKPSGERGERKVGLLAAKKVYAMLRPSIAPSAPFSIPLGHLMAPVDENGEIVERGVGRLKSFLFAMITARHTDIGHPLTNESIQQSLSRSRRTVQRHRYKLGNEMRTTRNYIQLYSSPTFEKTKNVLDIQIASIKAESKDKSVSAMRQPFRMAQRADQFIVIQQIANSYYMPQYDRISPRHRPKELKECDLNIGLESPRIYLTKTEQHTQGSRTGDYLHPVGHARTPDKQRVRIWAQRSKLDGKDVTLPDPPPVSKQFAQKYISD